jgi:hypothetical protein
VRESRKAVIEVTPVKARLQQPPKEFQNFFEIFPALLKNPTPIYPEIYIGERGAPGKTRPAPLDAAEKSVTGS